LILILRKISAAILLVGILNCTAMPARAVEADPAESMPAAVAQETMEDPAPEETLVPVIEETAPELPGASQGAEKAPATGTETEPPEEVPTAETEAPGENTPEVASQQEEIPASIKREMPLYFQNDYPDARFGNGTVETDGCGITAVAMVATYMTGHEYRPDTLAGWFGRYGYNNVERVEYASQMLRLPFKKARDINQIIQQLENGNVAIILMDSDSVFTDSQHFIVLKGITEDGKILVNDPYGPNYDTWQLRNGLENGFTREYLIHGYAGGWIYDVGAMPEEPYIYSAPMGREKVFVEHWKNMPQYDQNDYPNDRFGAGTVATSGCAITALAMVASYMTGHEYLPSELADWFGGCGINNVERLEYASDMLQLPYRQGRNIHDILEEVRTGNIAILLVNAKSIFSNSQHFIVLTGMTKDGCFMVSDPNARSYNNIKLREGFEKGFTEEQLTKGYDGGWVYDYKSMPEEPFIYEEKKPDIKPRYPGIRLTLEEEDLLAKVIWVEARGESAEGQQAIAEIVFNRMVSPDFPDTVAGVIYAENQFRSVKFLEDAEPWQAQYDAIERALEGPYVLPMNVFHFARAAVNDNVWGKIGGHVFCYQWDDLKFSS